LEEATLDKNSKEVANSFVSRSDIYSEKSRKARNSKVLSKGKAINDLR